MKVYLTMLLRFLKDQRPSLMLPTGFDQAFTECRYKSINCFDPIRKGAMCVLNPPVLGYFFSKNIHVTVN